MRKVILITALALLIYLVLGWFAGTWLGLEGSKLWIFRGALWIIGLAAAGFAIWFFWNKKKQEKAAANGVEPAGIDEIGILIREAGRKLSQSRLAKGARFGSLPVVFVMGEAKSAKTSTIIHSGLDVELLAGHVFQDSDVLETRAANFWYGKGAVFVEAAGRFVNDSQTWVRIARGLQPRGMMSALSSGSQAPTAALVTVDAESLFRPGAADSVAASARRLRARLTEISEDLGVHLPVYVLFTRTDRVPFFAEFTRNLTDQEAAQVFGATVPMTSGAEGVYAEQEASRLTAAFERLVRSLCAMRPAILAREYDAVNLPGAYEFPRELRKLRPNLVQFLVDLCRPSQLTIGPFLRGFYFSGVRPVVVSEAARGAAAPAAAPQRQAADGATSMFRLDSSGSPMGAPAAAPPPPAARRVPQWVFLSHFFHYLILADRGARDASGASTKTSLLRRVLLISAGALCLLYCIALAFSYGRNHALESRIQEASRGIQSAAPAASGGASLDSLTRLESLRQSLALVSAYRTEGAPLSFHWGLYSVDSIYPYARRIYFDNFQKVLLAQTQKNLADGMRTLPATPGPDYGPTYDSLKAYLITTSNPDKSVRAFLSPVLSSRWSAGQNVDAQRLQLAQKQFDFYAEELKLDNPLPTDADQAAVAKSRHYLNQFAGLERVYAAMLADASKNTTPINFNRRFPGSAETVLDAYDVPGAFTKPGWDFMRNSLKDPEKYFSGEQWVLGPQGAANLDKDKLGAQLASRYYSDFTKHWRNYLKSASVVKYADIKDAAKKLNVISGNQSTLLALFSLASQNTAVDVPEVANQFQPVQAVVPPAAVDRYIGPSNQAYMNALLQLQTAVDTASQAPELNDQVAAPTLTNASAARIAAKQVAQAFRADPEGHIDGTVEKLMEDPITNVEALLKRLGPDELNAKGKDLCGQYRKLMAKYPFNPNVAAPPASVAEVNAVYHPGDGALWTFYDSSLKKLLVKQGTEYAPAAGGGAVTLTPQFLKFFNQAAGLSNAWYAGGSPDPHFNYSLKPVPADGIQTVGLLLDGQSLTYSGGAATSKQFTWTGKDSNEAKATVRFGGGPDLAWSNNQGVWSVFQFFAKAEAWRPSGDAETLEWVIRIGKDPVTLPSGKPLTVRFDLDMAGAPPVFQKGYVAKTGCVAEVAAVGK